MSAKKPVSLFLLVFLVFLSLFSPAACLTEAAAPASQIRTGDILCFGTPDPVSAFDGKWLVLDPSHTSTGEDGIFLVSLNLVGSETGGSLLYKDIGDVSVSFSDRGEAYAAAHPGVLNYPGSDIQQWCLSFPERYLSDAEQQALLPTYKSDPPIAITGFGIPLPGVSAGTVDFDGVDNILNGDTVFLLSTEEAVNPAYGLKDSRSRVATYKGTPEGWWLRSPHIPTFPLDVGFVYAFGSVMDFPVNARFVANLNSYARPACNLDASRITGMEKLAEVRGRTFWRVSFEGGETNLTEYDTTLPEIGFMLDIQALVWLVLLAPVLILCALIFLIVWLVRRRKRRKAS